MSDVVGVSLCVLSTLVTFASHRFIERGSREEKPRIRLLGSTMNVVAGLLVSASLFFSDETLVAVLGCLIVPFSYARERSKLKWLGVVVVLAGAVLMIVQKPASRPPNPYNDRLLSCVILGGITTALFYHFEPRPMYAGLMASLTETMTKALMSTSYVFFNRDVMIGTYTVAMIVFGVLQLVYLGECYKKRSQAQVVPEFIVSIMVYDALLAGWVFEEWNPEHWTFWVGMAVSSGAAIYLTT